MGGKLAKGKKKQKKTTNPAMYPLVLRDIYKQIDRYKKRDPIGVEGWIAIGPTALALGVKTVVALM